MKDCLSLHMVLDYVIRLSPKANSNILRTNIILEVQGGGETSSTGWITRHISHWASHEKPTNEFLSKQLNTEYLQELRNEGKTPVNVCGNCVSS